MACICPTEYKKNEKNVFEPKCGIDVFETFRTSFDLEKDEYLDYINKINDPTLKYVSVYLVQYYKDGFNYFRNSEQTYRSEACNYLNKWLKEKHDLFTFGNNCAEKQKLWEKVIGKLWTDLTKDRRYFYQSTDSWCTDRNYIFQTTFPLKVIELNCDKSISQETRSAISPPLTIQTERNCPPCSCPVISQETGHPQETGNPPETEQLSGTDRTKNLAVTSGFTAFGTLGTLLILYKFTPMASWFRRPGMNNIGTDLYMDPGTPDGFLRMQGGSGNNNIFYHSSLE